MRKNIIKSTAILCAFSMLLTVAPAMPIHAEDIDSDDVIVSMDDDMNADDDQDFEEMDNTEETEEAVDEDTAEEDVDVTDSEEADDADYKDDADYTDDADYSADEEENVYAPEESNEATEAEESQPYEEPYEETVEPEQPSDDVELATTLTDRNTRITLSKSNYVYNGKAKTPAVTVVCEDVELLKDVDFTASYANNVNAGKATVTIQGIGNYDGTITKSYTIGKAGQKFSAKANKNRVERKKRARISYTGAQGKVVFTSSNKKIATVNGKGVVKAKKPGNVTITVTSKATPNYKQATSKIKIKVIGTVLSSKNAKIKLSRSTYTYNGKAKKPAAVVTYKGKNLKKGRDFKVFYENNRDAGKATVVICGMGNYSDKICKTFSIKKADNHLKASVTSTVINVKEKAWVDVDRADGDVTFASSNSKVAQVTQQGKITGKKKGECTITVTAAGDNNHKKAVKKFKILVGPRALTDKACKVTLSADRFVYDGTAKKPQVSINCNGMKLALNKDFTAVYENNVNAGTARIRLFGKGLYKGTRVVEFQIEKAEQKDFTVDVVNNRIPLNSLAKVNVRGGIGPIRYGTYSPDYAKHMGAGWFKGLRRTKNYITITVTAAGNNNYKPKTIEKRVSIS